MKIPAGQIARRNYSSTICKLNIELGEFITTLMPYLEDRVATVSTVIKSIRRKDCFIQTELFLMKKKVGQQEKLEEQLNDPDIGPILKRKDENTERPA